MVLEQSLISKHIENESCKSCLGKKEQKQRF